MDGRVIAWRYARCGTVGKTGFGMMGWAMVSLGVIRE